MTRMLQGPGRWLTDLCRAYSRFCVMNGVTGTTGTFRGLTQPSGPVVSSMPLALLLTG